MKFDSDIVVIKDNCKIDGKSALGILTIDLLKPLIVEIHSNDENEISKFNDAMEEFKWEQ